MLWSDINREAFVPSLLKRLEARIAETGETDAQFARRLGSSEALLKNLRNGSLPNIERLHVLLRELGETMSIGAPLTNSYDCIPQEEYVGVPLMSAELAAGAGSINEAEEVTDYLSFRREWFRKIDVSPKKAVLAHVRGDSMSPTLSDRDVVLIDTAMRHIAPRPSDYKSRRPPIYALMVGAESRIKRISIVDAGLVALISDNPDYSPEFRNTSDPDELRIVGRVVWWGHTVRD